MSTTARPVLVDSISVSACASHAATDHAGPLPAARHSHSRDRRWPLTGRPGWSDLSSPPYRNRLRESGRARWISAELGYTLCFLSRWSRQESRVRTSLAGRYKNVSRQGWETEEETEGEREWGAAAKQVMSSAPSAVQGSWRPCLSNWGRVGLPVGASDLPSPEAEPGTAQFLVGRRPWRIRRATSSWRPSTPQSPVRTSSTASRSPKDHVELTEMENRALGPLIARLRRAAPPHGAVAPPLC